MPVPVSVRPPRPGDGSGLVEREEVRRERRRQEEKEAAYRRHIERKRERALEEKAYRAYRQVILDD